MTDKNATLVPEQGWHCLHLFYHVEYGHWQLLSREEQNSAKTNLATLVQEVRAMDSTQLVTLSVVTPKADLGFMLITPDLQTANKIEKQLSLSFGADVLTPVYSYLSLTEESEYFTTEEEYVATLDPETKREPAKQEEVYAQAAQLPRKPYPSVEGIKKMMDVYDYREMRLHRPEDFYDASFVAELDQSGYIDGLYKGGGAAR